MRKSIQWILSWEIYHYLGSGSQFCENKNLFLFCSLVNKKGKGLLLHINAEETEVRMPISRCIINTLVDQHLSPEDKASISTDISLYYIHSSL